MSPRMRCTDSAPSASRRTVISSPHVASQSGQVRKAVRVDVERSSRVGGHPPCSQTTAWTAERRRDRPAPGCVGSRRMSRLDRPPSPTRGRHDRRGVRVTARPPRRIGPGSGCAWSPRSTGRPSSAGARRAVERQRLGGDAAAPLARRRDHRRRRHRPAPRGTARPRRAGLRIGVVTASGRRRCRPPRCSPRAPAS